MAIYSRTEPIFFKMVSKCSSFEKHHLCLVSWYQVKGQFSHTGLNRIWPLVPCYHSYTSSEIWHIGIWHFDPFAYDLKTIHLTWVKLYFFWFRRMEYIETGFNQVRATLKFYFFAFMQIKHICPQLGFSKNFSMRY